MNKLTIRDICHIALFTAVIAVLAQISIPMPAGVPMTLQTFAVPLAGIILGRKKGFLSALVYVLLGAVGVPVFASFTGGIGIVLGVTGGFIVSFPLMAWLAGRGTETGSRAAFWAGLVLGSAANYVIGTVWFMAAAHADLMTALLGCVVPFIPTAIIKVILAGLLGMTIRKALLKSGVLAAA